MAYRYFKFGDSCHYRHNTSQAKGALARNESNEIEENKLLKKSLDDLDRKYAKQQEVIDKLLENQAKQDTSNNAII